ncbi:hypothetical protein N0V84_012789 [Fusarium piperis]|uniref:Uncharacterized protein n=1 Tax=Fusarium piperis TaxID=1435070 RepID=A0A9W8TAU1_9HYPO|nr:hypothetical protein N0V84_012789 [Fusarium piperis]
MDEGFRDVGRGGGFFPIGGGGGFDPIGVVFLKFAPPGGGIGGRPGMAGAAPIGGFGAEKAGGFGADVVGSGSDRYVESDEKAAQLRRGVHPSCRCIARP